jgi:hypothetical protein
MPPSIPPQPQLRILITGPACVTAGRAGSIRNSGIRFNHSSMNIATSIRARCSPAHLFGPLPKLSSRRPDAHPVGQR